jgi:hypothetical protein
LSLYVYNAPKSFYVVIWRWGDAVTAAADPVIAVVERAHLILLDSFQTRKIKHC